MALEDLPRRIYLDTCTVQVLHKYGNFIWDGEAIPANDPIFRITFGLENLESLRKIFLVNERALFEWIVSDPMIEETRAKGDRRQFDYVIDIAHHSQISLSGDVAVEGRKDVSKLIAEPKFGYLGRKDRILLESALRLNCDAFLTMERRLPQNASHFFGETGLRIMTPTTHWEALRPYATLWL